MYIAILWNETCHAHIICISNINDDGRADAMNVQIWIRNGQSINIRCQRNLFLVHIKYKLLHWCVFDFEITYAHHKSVYHHQ